MAAALESIPIEFEGVTVDAVAFGQGDPVLLVHGYTSSKEAWFLNLQALAQHFRVLALDLPGHGRSSKVAPDRYLAFCSEWLVRLLDRQQIEAAHVIGNSMGGAVAMELALSQPSRMRKLVLVDALGMGAQITGGDVLVKLVESQTREEVQAQLSRVVHDPAHILPQAVDLSFTYLQQPGVKALLRKIGAQLSDGKTVRVDFRPRFKDLRMPVLVVWGREDRLIPVAHAYAAREMPDARIHIFERCGHLPQLEQAAAFNELVTGFLQQP
jgi:pimeloyl-ACP methyl ester carboxylesterase